MEIGGVATPSEAVWEGRGGDSRTIGTAVAAVETRCELVGTATLGPYRVVEV